MRNIFFFKKDAENKVERLVAGPCLIFKLSKQAIITLLLIYFGRFRLGHTIKINFITFETADPKIFLILIFYKSVYTFKIKET